MYNLLKNSCCSLRNPLPLMSTFRTALQTMQPPWGPSLGTLLPVGNSTCHKTSCTLQGLQGQPSRAKPSRESVLWVISYTFLTFPFSGVSEGYISMQIVSCKAQESTCWPSGINVSVPKRASEWLPVRERIYNKSLSLDVTPLIPVLYIN